MRLDSLAIGCSYLKDFMGIDADEGISETSAQWYENSMEGLLKHLTTKTYGSYMMDTYDEGMENVANVEIFD